MLQGLLPEVRSAIQEGRFSFSDLLQLPGVKAEPESSQPGVYLRLYTQLDNDHSDPDDTAVYIRSTKVKIWKRHSDHEYTINSTMAITDVPIEWLTYLPPPPPTPRLPLPSTTPTTTIMQEQIN